MTRLNVANEASTQAPGSIGRGRVLGVDVARALAIFGMLAVHVGPTDARGVFGHLYALPHGRASILFLLVAGMGVSLLTASRQTSGAAGRWKLVWRAALLLPIGLGLQGLDHGVNVILQDYALLFLLAILLVQLSDRLLLSLAAVSVILGPAAYLWGRAMNPELFDRSPTSLVDPVGEILHGLVLSGPYPLITWLSPFLVGLWLGRRNLRSQHLRTRLIGTGAAMLALTWLTSRVLVSLVGAPTGPGDVRHLVTAVPHSQMPLWLVGSTGAALLTVGSSLVVADRAPRVTWPVAAAGQLALTAYVGHLLALHAWTEALRSDDVFEAALLLAGFSVVIMAAATAWRSAFARGPLELTLQGPWLLIDRSRRRERVSGSG